MGRDEGGTDEVDDGAGRVAVVATTVAGLACCAILEGAGGWRSIGAGTSTCACVAQPQSGPTAVVGATGIPGCAAAWWW